MTTNSSGGCLELHDYLPFGEDTINTLGGRTGCYGTSDGVAEKFTGKERDAETSNDYFGARYFSGAQGRFTSADSPFIDQGLSDPQSWNLYTYGRNNPLRFVDPTGRECVRVTDSDGNAHQADDGTGGGCADAKVDPSGQAQSQVVSVGVGSDEANLLMLQRVGENASSLNQWAEVGRKGMEGAMTIEGLASLPSLARSLWSVATNWRAIAQFYRAMDQLLWSSDFLGESDFAFQYQRAGGYQQALSDFKTMVADSSIVDNGNGIKVSILPDGAKVTVRPGSGSGSSGPATLDVIRPGVDKVVKFRY